MMLLLTLCAFWASAARVRSEDGEGAHLPTVTRLLSAKGDPLAMPRESLLRASGAVGKADGFQVGAAALARAPPPRMADDAAAKTPKKAKKVKAKSPSPFGKQPEVADPEYEALFGRPKDFVEGPQGGGLPEQWDNYAGGRAVSASRNFEGPSWERAYAEWAKNGIPRPSESQKSGRMPNLAPATNKAAAEYDARRPDYSDGPMYRGKPKVTENYRKMNVDKYQADKYEQPEPWYPTDNSRGYP